MPSIPYGKGADAKEKVYVGLLYDEYTPQVEGQLIRDCFALQNVSSPKEEIVIVSDSKRADHLLDSLGLRRIPTIQLAHIWLLYKTKEFWPQLPHEADTKTVIQRDLWVRKSSPKLVQTDEASQNGYYLPPQGRLSPDTLSLERPAPNGYVPVTEGLVNLVFGP